MAVLHAHLRAIDQGTTSTRAFLFDAALAPVGPRKRRFLWRRPWGRQSIFPAGHTSGLAGAGIANPQHPPKPRDLVLSLQQKSNL